MKKTTNKYVKAIALTLALITLLSSVGVMSVFAAEYEVSAGGSGNRYDISVPEGGSLGQRVHVNGSFSAISFCIPTYHTSGSNATVSVYRWDTTYYITVSKTPLVTKTFTNCKDNAINKVDFGKTLPAGEYLFLIHNTSGKIGCYAYSSNSVSLGYTYKNGDKQATDLQLNVYFAESVSTHFKAPVETVKEIAACTVDTSVRVDGQILKERGQRVVVNGNIYGFAFTIPTYNTSNSSVTLSAYKWNADYDTTVSGTPIASTRIENCVDCAKYWLYFDKPYPAGDYLFLAHDPSGSIGLYTYPTTNVSLGYTYSEGAWISNECEMFVCMDSNISTPFSQVQTRKETTNGVASVPPEYEIPRDSLIYTHEVMPDTWVFTDGLGRVSLTNAEVGDPKDDKTLAMFFWHWHYSGSDREPVNLQKLIEKYPEAKNDYNHAAWGGYGKTSSGELAVNYYKRFFWNESIYGHYVTFDSWVLRHQAELLANAGVDVIFNDNSNYTWTFSPGYDMVFSEFEKAMEDGVNVPKVSFHLPMWETAGKTESQLEQLYSDIYYLGKYQKLWFYYDGKPMLIAERADLDSTNLFHKEIGDFFTLRSGMSKYNDADLRPNATDRLSTWGWSAKYPQPTYYKNASDAKNGIVEQISVSVAVNFDYKNQKLIAMNGNYVMGRSYSSKYKNRYDVQGDNATKYGYNFSEQFDYALSVDPKVIYVTGWNEWTVSPLVSWNGVTNAFADQFNDEFSRDIEPSKGALKDHYYYLLVNYSRKFKGARAIPEPSEAVTIYLNAGQAQWANVEPYYAAYIGNTDDRDCNGYGDNYYVDRSGRNDIIGAQIARDKNYIYFNVECADNITPYTDNLWMNLYLDTDQSNQGWETFDYVINKSAPSATTAVLEKFTGNGYASNKVADVEYIVDGRYMTIKVPKSALGISGYDFTINFTWTDNVHDADDTGAERGNELIYSEYSGDIMDFYVSGDVAPGGRFKYSYVSTVGNAADSETTMNLFNGTAASAGSNVYHWQKGNNFGQRFTIPAGKVMTSLNFGKMAINSTDTSGVCKIWQWRGDYASTVASTPLYTYNITGHKNDTAMSISVPAELGIEGEIYYEITANDDSGWGFSPFNLPNGATTPATVDNYCGGVIYETNESSKGTGTIYSWITTRSGGTLSTVNLYDGTADTNGGNLYHWQKGKNFGQKFSVSDDRILTGISFDKMGINTTTGMTSGTFKIWQWAGDYKTTVAQTPLYTYTIESHKNDTAMEISIPAHLAIGGYVYYEITADDKTSFGFSPFMLPSTATTPEDVDNYCGGVIFETNESSKGTGTILSRITVKVGTPNNTSGIPLYSGSDMGNTQYNYHKEYNKIGQKFTLDSDKILTGITFTKMNTMGDGGKNKGTFKVYAWAGNYANTVAQTPLYSVDLTNVSDGASNYRIAIPKSKGISGEIFYELTYNEGTGTYAPQNSAKGAAAGVVSYRNGVEYSGESSIIKGSGGIHVSVSFERVSYVYVNSIDKQVICTGNVKYEDMSVGLRSKFDAAANMYANGTYAGFDGTFTEISSEDGTVVYYTNHSYLTTVSITDGDGKTNDINTSERYVLLRAPTVNSAGEFFYGWYDTAGERYISYCRGYKYYLSGASVSLKAVYGVDASPESDVYVDLTRTSDKLTVTVTPTRLESNTVVEYGYYISTSDSLDGVTHGTESGVSKTIQNASKVSTRGTSAYLQRVYTILDATTDKNISVMAFITYIDGTGDTYTLYQNIKVAAPIS